jgi:hypothetical protein
MSAWEDDWWFGLAQLARSLISLSTRRFSWAAQWNALLWFNELRTAEVSNLFHYRFGRLLSQKIIFRALMNRKSFFFLLRR